MSKFPLYDNLSKDIANKDLSPSQKRSFIRKIKQIDDNGCELVYVLIRMYQIENDTNTSFTVPYNGIFSKNDISFDLDQFPNKLKQLLYKFLKVHINKMNEEKSIINQTSVKRI